MIDRDFIRAFKESERFKDLVFEEWHEQFRCECKRFVIIISAFHIQFISKGYSSIMVDEIRIIDGDINLYNVGLYVGFISERDLIEESEWWMKTKQQT